MKRIDQLLVIGVVFLSSNLALAAKFSCELENYVASKTGLMPSASKVVLNNIAVQTGDSIQEEGCQKIKIDEADAGVCVIQVPNTKDVYQAAIIMEGADSEDSFFNLAIGYNIFALHQNGKDLVSIKSESILHPNFRNKMDAAKASYPNYKGGDSYGIDVDVQAAVEKGIIKAGETVVVGVGNCQLVP